MISKIRTILIFLIFNIKLIRTRRVGRSRSGSEPANIGYSGKHGNHYTTDNDQCRVLKSNKKKLSSVDCSPHIINFTLSHLDQTLLERGEGIWIPRHMSLFSL
jgi:hypothetical protein